MDLGLGGPRSAAQRPDRRGGGGQVLLGGSEVSLMGIDVGEIRPEVASNQRDLPGRGVCESRDPAFEYPPRFLQTAALDEQKSQTNEGVDAMNGVRRLGG